MKILSPLMRNKQRDIINRMTEIPCCFSKSRRRSMSERLLFDDDIFADAVGIIVVAEEVGAQLSLVTSVLDVLEDDMVDAVAGGTVILGTEDYGHADEGGGINALHADVAEADVANPVLVAAGEVQDSVGAGI